MEKQTTIKSSVSFSGMGLHTGKPSTITFHPAPAGYGYKFVRLDVEPQFELPALVDYVVDLSRGTTLGMNGVQVHTVEHVLAALAGLRIDNCKIELSGMEPPVVDGSSMPYVEALLSVGKVDLDEAREYFIIEDTIHYKNDEKHVDIVALPTDDFRITVMIDYFNPALGSQHSGLFNLTEEFVTEFAPARTFCFLTEVVELYRAGLIKGGSLESAIVINDKKITQDESEELRQLFNLDYAPKPGDNGILNGTHLRFKNEPARHKLLDMIGDLALVGVPIKAQILAARPGHASNIAFGKMVRAKYLEQKSKDRLIPTKSPKFIQDIGTILEIMPHRYPMLLVDRIVSYNPETETIIGYKNVTINEEFFNGHFPGKPIMPGMLILESMAQTGGLLLCNKIDNIEKKIALFMGVKNAKFRKPVIPGDQLVMEVKLSARKFNTFTFECKAYVDGNLVAESELQAALVDR